MISQTVLRSRYALVKVKSVQHEFQTAKNWPVLQSHKIMVLVYPSTEPFQFAFTFLMTVINRYRLQRASESVAPMLGKHHLLPSNRHQNGAGVTYSPSF